MPALGGSPRLVPQRLLLQPGAGETSKSNMRVKMKGNGSAQPVMFGTTSRIRSAQPVKRLVRLRKIPVRNQRQQHWFRHPLLQPRLRLSPLLELLVAHRLRKLSPRQHSTSRLKVRLQRQGLLSTLQQLRLSLPRPRSPRNPRLKLKSPRLRHRRSCCRFRIPSRQLDHLSSRSWALLRRRPLWPRNPTHLRPRLHLLQLHLWTNLPQLPLPLPPRLLLLVELLVAPRLRKLSLPRRSLSAPQIRSHQPPAHLEERPLLSRSATPRHKRVAQARTPKCDRTHWRPLLTIVQVLWEKIRR